MSWPSVAPATERSFSRRSPRAKYVSTWRKVPTRSAPARRARALPRSSYLALSSTRCFEPASTKGETRRTRRSLPSSHVGGWTADSSGCDLLVDLMPARGFGRVERRFAASRCPFGWATASFSRSRWASRATGGPRYHASFEGQYPFFPGFYKKVRFKLSYVRGVRDEDTHGPFSSRWTRAALRNAGCLTS